jgi:hypothetical protein
VRDPFTVACPTIGKAARHTPTAARFGASLEIPPSNECSPFYRPRIKGRLQAGEFLVNGGIGGSSIFQTN